MMGIFAKKHDDTPRTARGERVYAIGDVHGRYDLLRKMLKIIIDHFGTITPKPKKVTLLFLGDVIDRGPDSRQCLGNIRSLVETGGARMLLGNHEDMMLASIDGNAQAQEAWLENGGKPALRSYGVAPPQPGEDAFDFAERLAQKVPEDHVAFLRSLDVSYASGGYLFVHAGVRPGIPIAQQLREDLYSIRDEFTTSSEDHGAVIVHGHSITDSVEVRKNRIACDTGAYRSDKLSCVCLQDDFLSVLTT